MNYKIIYLSIKLTLFFILFYIVDLYMTSNIFNNDNYSTEYKYILRKHLLQIEEFNLMPNSIIDTLNDIKINGEIKVIYDIGSSVLHFAKEARKIFPESEIILFDAFAEAEFLYKKNNYKYSICVLSDSDDKIVNFYKNPFFPGGNSYFKELQQDITQKPFFDEAEQCKTITLDTLIKNNNYQFPDLIKIDVQGCELDILKGASEILKHNKYLIIELQHIEYNKGAPLFNITHDYLSSIGYILVKQINKNNFDADYLYINHLN